MTAQRKPLKPKQIKFIKAKVAGKTNIAAAQEATGLTNPASAAVEATRMLKNANVQEELQKAFERHGITIDAATKPIADGLTAEREYYTDKQGNERGGGADHSVRLKASNMAFNLMGLGRNTEGTTNNFLIIANDQKEKYGL